MTITNVCGWINKQELDSGLLNYQKTLLHIHVDFALSLFLSAFNLLFSFLFFESIASKTVSFN